MPPLADTADRCPPAEALVLVAEGRCTIGVAQHAENCEACRDALQALHDEGASAHEPGGPLGMRYRLSRVKAQGGQGVICEAWDRLLDRRVAIKLVRSESTSAEDLLREAKLLATFRHPHVVTVHDAGVDDGHVFVVMDLVDGETADFAARRVGFTPGDARRIVAQVATGLEAMHDAGIVHGDVSAKNIIVEGNGHARLLDLGLSTNAGEHRGGTPGFDAPEARAEGRTSALADQFGLGRTLRALLSASHERSRATEAVARRASHADPRRRYPSLRAFRRALWLAPLRTAATVGLAALAITSLGQPEDDAAKQMTDLETRTMDALVDGEFEDADRLVDFATVLADAEDSDALRARALILQVRAARSDDDTRPRLERAVALAEASKEPVVRAEALALLATDHESPEATRALAQLADAAAAAAEDSSAIDQQLAAMRAVTGLPQPPGTKPTPITEAFGELSAAFESIGDEDAAPVSVQCDAMEGVYTQGLCWSVSAVGLVDKYPDLAMKQAELALDLLRPVADPCELQLALIARGLGALERNPTTSASDLLEAIDACDDETEAELAELRGLAALALANAGRVAEAREQLALAERWAADFDPELRAYVDRARHAIDG